MKRTAKKRFEEIDRAFNLGTIVGFVIGFIPFLVSLLIFNL